MLYARLELWPGGDRSRRKVLGHVTISNDGTSGDPRRGDYAAQVYGDGGRRQLEEAHVFGFPRLRLTGWDLLLRALLAARWYKQREALRRILGGGRGC